MKKQIVLLIILLISLQSQTLLGATKILFLGDSLTAGYGIEKNNAFPNLIFKELRTKGYKDIQVINGGISGSTSASALSRLNWYLKISPDIMILALGANDGLRGLSVEQLKTNLIKCIQLAKKKGIQVILAGMMMPPNYGKAYTDSFRQVYPDVAELLEVELIPFLLKDVAGIPSLNLPDGIHPNEDGHKIVARTIIPFIIKKL